MKRKLLLIPVLLVALVSVGLLSSTAVVFANDCPADNAATPDVDESDCHSGGGGGGGGSAVTSACEGVESLGVKCDASGSAQDVIDGPIGTLVDLLSYAVGIACVVMIIYGGFRFITSGGNADATKSARNTILYALVGLFIVLTVQILINFVFGQANEINNPTAPASESAPEIVPVF